ncbi:uncharacterized protein CLUP02_04904 [Colletotrichum lupini]|uniref:Uncharacterized protein n=1 Tax=Colletotrichum lupini TaxID=145971 RepID=A0A9Q8SL86_9PEZI|nr:uncharacterized protein CLUP02_04904 [Colletotrichum lupini]UQC79424.1 hypothetical protein CLUP02_04904 [Colletotrichum lupini]
MAGMGFRSQILENTRSKLRRPLRAAQPTQTTKGQQFGTFYCAKNVYLASALPTKAQRVHTEVGLGFIQRLPNTQETQPCESYSGRGREGPYRQNIMKIEKARNVGKIRKMCNELGRPKILPTNPRCSKVTMVLANADGTLLVDPKCTKLRCNLLLTRSSESPLFMADAIIAVGLASRSLPNSQRLTQSLHRGGLSSLTREQSPAFVESLAGKKHGRSGIWSWYLSLSGRIDITTFGEIIKSIGNGRRFGASRHGLQSPAFGFRRPILLTALSQPLKPRRLESQSNDKTNCRQTHVQMHKCGTSHNTLLSLIFFRCCFTAHPIYMYPQAARESQGTSLHMILGIKYQKEVTKRTVIGCFGMIAFLVPPSINNICCHPIKCLGTDPDETLVLPGGWLEVPGYSGSLYDRRELPDSAACKKWPVLPLQFQSKRFHLLPSSFEGKCASQSSMKRPNTDIRTT